MMVKKQSQKVTKMVKRNKGRNKDGIRENPGKNRYRKIT